ncbi:MAG: hypothetical protein MJ096_01475 [Clostridia bacterium]|nr:hypothetical protein [Clostridia bacterium]
MDRIIVGIRLMIPITVESANSITVYVDGAKVAKFDGGTDKTITLTPGYHTLQASVNNDAAASKTRAQAEEHQHLPEAPRDVPQHATNLTTTTPRN